MCSETDIGSASVHASEGLDDPSKVNSLNQLASSYSPRDNMLRLFESRHLPHILHFSLYTTNSFWYSPPLQPEQQPWSSRSKTAMATGATTTGN